MGCSGSPPATRLKQWTAVYPNKHAQTVSAAGRLNRAGRFESAPAEGFEQGGRGGRHALRGGLGERPQLAGTRYHSTPDSKFPLAQA